MEFSTFLETNAAILIVAFLAAFIIDYMANLMSFSSRWASAAVTAVLLVAALVFTLVMNREDIAVQPLALAGGLMFVVALAGNMLHFGNRFLNAFLTAVIFMIPFAIGLYVLAGFSHGSGITL